MAREWRRSSSPALGLFLQSLPREMFARLPSWLGWIVWVLLFLFFKGFWVLELFFSKPIFLMGRNYHFLASCIYEQLRISSDNGKSWATFSEQGCLIRLCLAKLTLACLWDAWSSSAVGHVQLKASLAWLERQHYCFHMKPGQGNITGLFVAPSRAAGSVCPAGWSSREELPFCSCPVPSVSCCSHPCSASILLLSGARGRVRAGGTICPAGLRVPWDPPALPELVEGW